MGFDFDCVLCLLLMFHPFYTSSQLDALTLALEIWTICYYVTFDLHSTMVSPAKRCVIGLRTMSFKKVSLSLCIHSLPVFVFSLLESISFRPIRLSSVQRIERKTKYCIRLHSISLCGIFSVSAILQLPFVCRSHCNANRNFQRELYIQLDGEPHIESRMV